LKTAAVEHALVSKKSWNLSLSVVVKITSESQKHRDSILFPLDPREPQVTALGISVRVTMRNAGVCSSQRVFSPSQLVRG
jgi:hypothetical protein